MIIIIIIQVFILDFLSLLK